MTGEREAVGGSCPLPRPYQNPLERQRGESALTSLIATLFRVPYSLSSTRFRFCYSGSRHEKRIKEDDMRLVKEQKGSVSDLTVDGLGPGRAGRGSKRPGRGLIATGTSCHTLCSIRHISSSDLISTLLFLFKF